MSGQSAPKVQSPSPRPSSAAVQRRRGRRPAGPAESRVGRRSQRTRLRRHDRTQSYLLRGRHAVLAGAPELIVSRDEPTLIVIVPTGPPLRSHGTLVRIYMYALRRAPGPHRGMVLPGELVYQDRTQLPQGGVEGLTGTSVTHTGSRPTSPHVRVPVPMQPRSGQLPRCGWPPTPPQPQTIDPATAGHQPRDSRDTPQIGADSYRDQPFIQRQQGDDQRRSEHDHQQAGTKTT